jgi:peptidyl-prolyl cis-trans isomerase SurA
MPFRYPHSFTTALRPVLLALIILAPFLTGTAGAAASPDNGIDRIMVIVNDDVITESELRAREAEVRQRLISEKIQAPAEAVLRKQVLERIVVELLQLQLARLGGITADDDKVASAIQNIAQQNRMSLADLYKRLEKQGMDEKRFRAQIHDQLLIQQLLEREINNRINVSETEVENFLANSENREGGVEYNLSHILITLPESATPEIIQKTRARAEALRDELRQGADFAQTAIANSQGQNALEGGGLGWKKAGQLPALFVTTLKSMRAGEISDVLRSPGGFHILRLNETRGGKKALTVSQTRARHILVRINEIVTPDEAVQRIRQLRARIDNGVDFAQLARSNSEDPGSASNGGDLGWMNPGQTVPEFEQAMDALKPGELSKPVRSPFGVHLIQVLERRERDVTNERNQADARQQIHARKADERFEQWIRQLRDEAYIEYRTEQD